MPNEVRGSRNPHLFSGKRLTEGTIALTTPIYSKAAEVGIEAPDLIIGAKNTAYSETGSDANTATGPTLSFLPPLLCGKGLPNMKDNHKVRLGFAPTFGPPLKIWWVEIMQRRCFQVVCIVEMSTVHHPEGFVLFTVSVHTLICVQVSWCIETPGEWLEYCSLGGPIS